ncbi:hypothetical protein GCG21_08985 [Pseudactinotalea sp. HY160]|uniref:hypothetical protein n=1 Tax=Pseudactinotalea sp. HY160 TaxID=2654490 RepID=UPI00128C37C0|nr:hypothetical protein [Pseudactinotalea sp. HY160]MPV50137.1 hypothetical protein [Pseudactinotalea sp. HY160]
MNIQPATYEPAASPAKTHESTAYEPEDLDALICFVDTDARIDRTRDSYGNTVLRSGLDAFVIAAEEEDGQVVGYTWAQWFDYRTDDADWQTDGDPSLARAQEALTAWYRSVTAELDARGRGDQGGGN